MVKSFSVVKQRKLGREGPELCSAFSHHSFYLLKPPFLTQNGQQGSHSLPAAGTKTPQPCRLGRPRSRCPQSPCLSRACFLAHRWQPGLAKGLSGVSHQGTNPIREGPTLMTHHLPKAAPLTTITLGIRLHDVNGARGGDRQPTAARGKARLPQGGGDAFPPPAVPSQALDNQRRRSPASCGLLAPERKTESVGTADAAETATINLSRALQGLSDVWTRQRNQKDPRAPSGSAG